MIGKYDAAVIGGGPAGTITAGILAEDYEVVVFEEHSSSGLPMQCAGLVTQGVLDMCEVVPEILNRIKGADVVFPGGGRIEVRSKETKALLIDRTDLDRKLADKASDKGAEIRYGTKYSAHKTTEDGVLIEADGKEIISKLIIGADGQGSAVAMSLGNNLPKEYVSGIEVDVKHTSVYDDIMVLRIGSEFAPGFFSWEIPFGDMTRIGLCVNPEKGIPIEYLKKLMKELNIGTDEITSKYAGKIPLGGRPRSFGERTLLIGDAAGQVKPVSGGGLQPICKAAPILGRIAKESIAEDRTSSEFLSGYEKEWKKELGRELSNGYRIRKIYNSLSDEKFDKVFGIIDREDIRSILNGIDLDNPSGVARPMLKHPGVGIRLLPMIMRGLL
ncbi:digeranylgeranylglycerophospholipid reductase [Candidatus Methanoplasma termitum]|uniref:Digeranylgeranylglycerophospholipid reductase n=1 Tax=Candidatus Methanoplasma termitum TaxID=1577791 RepID=A0A0A7LI24_9ARCH|nr:NAD(P)/FAD-dependent oxidoreductase [Candidatus Methanoplasma termitum]AIZ57141.1 digeranylgeranylglycerophospholipid reductase [Candidatus Methanoplasma termitum]